MASTQRTTRRRTVIHAFEDEDESAQPAAKRAKTEKQEKQVNGTAKRAKASYDEDDDGFQFSRSRAKRKQPKAAAPPEPAVVPVAEELKPATPAKRRRKKYSFSDHADKDSEEAPKTRRSKRLSGDKAPTAQTPVPHSRRVKKVQDAPPHDEPPAVAAPLEVPVLEAPKPEVAARSPKKISLPFADTPVIRRNKEMRKKAGSEQSHRRSSTGMRGRRASSLIESGQSSAVPHKDVEVQDFYKHIEQSLPEPRRMQQLLTWCGTRLMPEKQSGNGGDGGAALAARHIEEEILKDLSNKPEMADWFTREEVAPAVLVKRPNPRNVQMASKLEELEMEIKRLQDERDTWESLLEASSAPTARQSQTPEQAPSDGERRPKLRPPPIEADVPSQAIDVSLLDPSQAAIYASLTAPSASASASAEALSTQVSLLASKLEPAIDVFADGVHKLSQYRLAAERVADRVLSSAARGLERRSRDVQRQAAAERGVDGGGARDAKPVLEALAGVLNGQ